jgi:hypothetical protein
MALPRGCRHGLRTVDASWASSTTYHMTSEKEGARGADRKITGAGDETVEDCRESLAMADRAGAGQHFGSHVCR